MGLKRPDVRVVKNTVRLERWEWCHSCPIIREVGRDSSETDTWGSETIRIVRRGGRGP